jgi:hypothetical protein
MEKINAGVQHIINTALFIKDNLGLDKLYFHFNVLENCWFLICNQGLIDYSRKYVISDILVRDAHYELIDISKEIVRSWENYHNRLWC